MLSPGSHVPDKAIQNGSTTTRIFLTSKLGHGTGLLVGHFVINFYILNRLTYYYKDNANFFFISRLFSPFTSTI
jgi:hypothetical protein